MLRHKSAKTSISCVKWKSKMDIQNITFCCHVTLYIEVGKEGFDINTPPPPKKNDGIYNETIKDRISQNSYLLTIYNESYFYPKSVK